MGGVFVIDWQVPGIQNRVSTIEAMEFPVCGTGAESPEHAVDAILVTQPDVVVAWANSHPDWTVAVLQSLQRVVAHATGEGGAASEATPTLPPFVFVDAPPGEREELEKWAPGATFVTLYEDVGAAVKKAMKASKRK